MDRISNDSKMTIETILLHSLPSSSNTNHIQCRNALKNLEEKLCPKLDALTAMELLQGRKEIVEQVNANIHSSSGSGSGSKEDDEEDPLKNTNAQNATVPSSATTSASLSTALFYILSHDDDYPESCRERACSCLKALVDRMTIASKSADEIQSCRKTVNYLKYGLLVEFCPIFAKRFEGRTRSDGGGSGGRMKKGAGAGHKPLEEAEEIRIMLVRIMNDIFAFLESESSLEQEQEHEHEKELTLIRAGSTLIHSLAKGALADPYPELQRESCILLKRLCHVSPVNRNIRYHLEMILRPIVGGVSSSSSSGSSSTCTNNEGSLLVASPSPSKDSLLCHRHAKTRVLAIETVIDIMMASSYYVNGDRDHAVTDGSTSESINFSTSSALTHSTMDSAIDVHKSNGKLLEILSSQVLPNLESVAPYDRSASVRSSLAKGVSSLLGLVFQCIRGHSGNVTGNDNGSGNCGDDHDPDLSSTRKSEIPNKFESSETTDNVISRLLVLFLMGISDDSPKISETSMHCMKEMMASSMSMLPMSPWAKIGRGSHDDKGSNDGDSDNDDDVISTLIASFAGQVLDIMLTNIHMEYILEKKRRFLESLSFAVLRINQFQNNSNCGTCCGEEEGTSNTKNESIWNMSRMTKIATALCGAFSSDEKYMFQAASKCAIALGSGKNARKASLGLILEALQGESQKDENSLPLLQNSGKAQMIVSSSSQFASALFFLAGLFRGTDMSAPAATVKDELNAVASILASERVLENVHNSDEVAFALLDACHAVADIVVNVQKDDYCAGDNVIRDILLCCVYLHSCKASKKPCKSLLSYFAEGIPGVRDVTNLLRVHFQALLDIFILNLQKSGGRKWSTGDSSLLAFDSFIRMSGGGTVGEYFNKIGPILEVHLASSSDPTLSKEEVQQCLQTKIFFMALVESIVSDPGLPKHHLLLFSEQLLNNAIIPNLVWQAGSRASVLRKLAAAVLFSIVHSDEAIKLVLCKLAPKLLPVLKSNLSDDDNSIRELVTASLARIFEILPAALGERAIDQLYPELMKGLDDNSENVRYASCDALKHFLSCGPPKSFHGTAIEYMVENLFIHLDDPNPAMQERVYNALVASLAIDQDVVTKNAKLSMSSHRSPKYCNKILGLVASDASGTM